MGDRISKITDGQTTYQIWNGENIVAETGAQTAAYYYGNNLIEMVQPTGGYYYLYNGHGDTAWLLDEGGNKVEDYRYDAFGNQTTEESTLYNPFRYNGQYTDEETGLIYLRNRYYDPSIGRFITEDPVRDGLNWYAYCSNNPVTFVDPTGMAFDIYDDFSYEQFEKYAKRIMGDDVVIDTIEYEDGSYSVIGFDNITQNSSVGASLLQYLAKGDFSIEVMFKYEKGHSSAFGRNDNYVVDVRTSVDVDFDDPDPIRADNEDNIMAKFVHELAHVYVRQRGYDTEYAKLVNFDTTLVKGYDEATAMIVEARFRKEMGLEPRDNEQGMISTREFQEGDEKGFGYGFYAWVANKNPQSAYYNKINITYFDSLKSFRITSDIVRNAANLF